MGLREVSKGHIESRCCVTDNTMLVEVLMYTLIAACPAENYARARSIMLEGLLHMIVGLCVLIMSLVPDFEAISC